MCSKADVPVRGFAAHPRPADHQRVADPEAGSATGRHFFFFFLSFFLSFFFAMTPPSRWAAYAGFTGAPRKVIPPWRRMVPTSHRGVSIKAQGSGRPVNPCE